jgi:hypothetical protein
MTLDFKKARELCTEPEFALVAASRPASLRSLTPRLLRMKVVRARGLRDKFRDLAHRQTREARRKAPSRGKAARASTRTVEKAELFAEVLRRFEGRAEKLDLEARTEPTAAVSTGRPSARASRAKAPKRAARPPRRGRTRWQAADARKEAKLETSHVPRKRAHVSSRNRRGQSRRDSRASR